MAKLHKDDAPLSFEMWSNQPPLLPNGASCMYYIYSIYDDLCDPVSRFGNIKNNPGV